MRSFTLFVHTLSTKSGGYVTQALLSLDQPQTGHCPHVMSSAGLGHQFPHMQNVSTDTAPSPTPAGLGENTA